jgi:hypothetical protein
MASGLEARSKPYSTIAFLRGGFRASEHVRPQILQNKVTTRMLANLCHGTCPLPPHGTSSARRGFRDMENNDQPVDPQLRELLDIEVADIVATANEQGFATKDILAGLAAAVANALRGLQEDPDPADDSVDPPAGPHAAADLVDRSKTPGTGALVEASNGDVDPRLG